MPQIQVLPGAPGFGSQLGQALGGGLSQGISAGLQQSLQEKNQKQQGKAIAEMLGTPEFATQLGALPDEFQKEIVKQIHKGKQEDSLQNEEYTNILDTMDNMLEEGQAGKLANLKSYTPWGGAERESTARFQSLGTSLLGLAQKVALKQGIRNQREFQVFMDRTIPNANDTVETAKGKIKGLRDYLKTGKMASSISKETESSNSDETQTFEKMPSASKFEGKFLEDENTGRRFKSNGKKWTEVK